MNSPVVSLSFLKQKAKQLKKEKALKHSEALNEASRQFGYPNYKSFLNVWKAGREQAKSKMDLLLKSISSESKYPKKSDLAITFLQKNKIPFHDLLDILKMFRKSKKALNTVCGGTDLKDFLQTFMFKDFQTEENLYEVEFWNPNFKPKEIFLKNLEFELKGEKLLVYGEYDLKIIFAYEYDENDPANKDFNFNDRWMFGTFEIEIDKDKNIEFLNSDIGENIDGSQNP